jgi:hypothetical protein
MRVQSDSATSDIFRLASVRYRKGPDWVQPVWKRVDLVE